jgi:hypothetical protein
LVEQRIENPRVGGSNPPPGTTIFSEAQCEIKLLAAQGRILRHATSNPFVTISSGRCGVGVLGIVFGNEAEGTGRNGISS